MEGDLGPILFQLLEAAGAQEGVVYLSVPVTSGQRELRLMRELRLGWEEIRVRHRERWVREVVEPNRQVARLLAGRLRRLFPTRLVIDPSPLDIAGWSQEDYQTLWAGLLERYEPILVPGPEWAWSKGSRLEMRQALQLGIDLADTEGQPIDPLRIVEEDRRVRSALAADGWTGEQIDAYLPTLG